MALSTESRFFGLDLTQLKADILKTWRKAPQWPPISWLQPEQALTLWPAVGEPTVVWESGSAATAPKRAPDAWAVELPESMVLRKNLQLPAMDAEDCASAAQLEVESISPFPSADLLWGYTELVRNDKLVRLQLVLASRAQVEPLLQSKIAQAQQSRAEGAKPLPLPEVWVFSADRHPIVIQGFGEGTRMAAGRRRLVWNLAGVALAVLLLAAIALTPSAQLRLRAIEATHAYERMADKTADVVAKREQLMRGADKVSALSDLLAERMDGVKVLSMLTQVLQDDTSLQSARIQGSKVTITGLTDNASRLMQKLSDQEGVKEVKAPSAATRMGGASGKESFTIELTLDPKVFGPTLKSDEPVVKKEAGEEAPPSPSSDAAVNAAGTPPKDATANTATPVAGAGAAAVAAGAAAAAASANKPSQAPSATPAEPPKRSGGATLGGSKPRPSLGGGSAQPPKEKGAQP